MKRKKQQTKKHNLFIEVVVWLDHFSHDGWASIDEINPSGMKITSVGFLIKEDKKALILAENLDIEGRVGSCYMNILKGDIVSRKRMRVKV